MKRVHSISICTLLALMIPALFWACAVKQKGPQQSEMIPPPVSTPGPTEIEPPPFLDSALQKANLNRSDLILPRFEETYYRLAVRFPLIDDLLGNPLNIPAFSKAESLKFQKIDRMTAAIAQMMDTIHAGSPIKVLTDQDVLAKTKPAKPKKIKVKCKSDMTSIMDRLAMAMESAVTVRNKAVANLSKEDIDFLSSDPGLFFYEADQFRFMTSPVTRQIQIIQILRKIDLPAVIQAQYALAASIEALLPEITAWSEKVPSQSTGIIYQADYPWGTMVIGGTSRNEYIDPAALIIDLGGDDLYLNNAGAAIPGILGVAVLVDVSGNDTYRTSSKFSLGSGFLGTGLICDLKGNDRYESGDFSQGVSFAGSGLIWDAEGDDFYVGQKFCQGSAAFGLGGIFDLSGNDHYQADEMAQGFASTLGFGVLYDRSGNDDYVTSEKGNGFSQGSGCGCRSYPWMLDLSIYGGCGFLIDDDGDDHYTAGSFSQGASYFLSLGVLFDQKGNDTYKAMGSYSHGGGVHMTAGCMIDVDGDDIYQAAWAGNAAGNDRSAGIFIDLSGNDRYYALDGDGQAYSHKPLGFSLFIDAAGDDIYRSKAYSQAYILPPITPDFWSHAVFIDAGGLDWYSMENRGNDMTWQVQPQAVGIDIKKEIVFDEIFPQMDSRMTGEEPEGDEIDPFLLLAQVGQLYEKGRANPDILADQLGIGTFAERRATEEALTLCLLDAFPEKPTMNGLAQALKAPDCQTRAYAAMTIEIHEFDTCKDALIEAYSESEPYIRKMIYRAAGAMTVFGGHRRLKNALETETDPICKGYGITALSRYGVEDYHSFFAAALTDPHEFVRMTAAYALGRSRAVIYIPELQKAVQDPSPYVRKAAGEALLQMGQRQGLKPMIDYLTFRALDTSSDNYGSNLGALLMEYTNEDFGRDYQRWIEWYSQNGETFDLDKNLKARENYLNAVKALRKNDIESAMTLFEKALKDNPDFRKAKVEYATLLNSNAWNMVTSPAKTEDLSRGLELARRCVELDEQAMYVDTLAEACYRNGLVEEAILHQTRAVALDPETQEYKTRLEKMKQK